MFGRAHSISYDRDPTAHDVTNAKEALPRSQPNPVRPTVGPIVGLTRCFLRLANLPNCALDRLSRYEPTLWRQARQILFALDVLDRRKPQERRRRFPCYDRPKLPASDSDDYGVERLRICWRATKRHGSRNAV
jgi:hypothetical protein